MNVIKARDISLSIDDITLSPLSDEHLPLLYKWNAHPEILPIDGTDDPEVVHKIYAACSEMGYCFLISFGDMPVGECVLTKKKLPNGEHDWAIDILIGETDFWGKGIAGKAVSALVDFALNTLNVNAVHATIDKDNTKSRKLFEKLNFILVNQETKTLIYRLEK